MGEEVKEGDHVVLMKSFDSGNMKILPVVKGSTVHYGKLHFDPGPLVGTHYGAVFEIRDGTMFEVEDFKSFDRELSEIMSSRISTFNEKTQFSQEKIIRKKKMKRNANVVTVLRPSLLLVNEMLFARDKIGGIRADLLAQLMTLSNIQAGSKCLVLDHNLGMLTSAVMSRILPDGVCIQLLQDYEILQTTRKTMKMLNINEEDCRENLCSITIRDLYKVYKNIDKFESEGEILASRNRAHLVRLSAVQESDGDSEAAKRFKSDEEDTQQRVDQLQTNLLRKEGNRELRQRERILAANYLKARSQDALIMAVQNDHPLPILKMVYQFLAPSGQFVIYSDTVTPLLDCYQYLKTNSLAVCVNITESWLRRYQVLPDRTRPEMNASGYGGYLLSGTKAIFGCQAEAASKIANNTA